MTKYFSLVALSGQNNLKLHHVAFYNNFRTYRYVPLPWRVRPKRVFVAIGWLGPPSLIVVETATIQMLRPNKIVGVALKYIQSYVYFSFIMLSKSIVKCISGVTLHIRNSPVHGSSRLFYLSELIYWIVSDRLASPMSLHPRMQKCAWSYHCSIWELAKFWNMVFRCYHRYVH